MKKEVRINRQIRANEVRVLNEDGSSAGVLSLEEAINLAQSRGVDLIEISAAAIPPVVKVMDYGKYQYIENKKAKQSKAASGGQETKCLQIKLATGEHDVERRAKQSSEFLKEGHRVKIDLFLSGRAKYMDERFLRERLDRILKLISENYKIVDGPKRSPKGLSVLLERAG